MIRPAMSKDNGAGKFAQKWVPYRPEIKVLDVTIRDGGLMNNHRFSDEVVRGVYDACVQSGIDYMEFGYKGSKKIFSPSEYGPWKFCDEEDVRRIVGAFIANVRAGEIRQGGSTLTQQLVKNFFLTPERTLRRKLQEALMALMVEARYDKPAILEAYLNEIYLGQRGATAIHGVGEASRLYFGKSVRDLELHESALIAEGATALEALEISRRTSGPGLRVLVEPPLPTDAEIDDDVSRET